MVENEWCCWSFVLKKKTMLLKKWETAKTSRYKRVTPRKTGLIWVNPGGLNHTSTLSIWQARFLHLNSQLAHLLGPLVLTLCTGIDRLHPSVSLNFMRAVQSKIWTSYNPDFLVGIIYCDCVLHSIGGHTPQVTILYMINGFLFCLDLNICLTGEFIHDFFHIVGSHLWIWLCIFVYANNFISAHKCLYILCNLPQANTLLVLEFMIGTLLDI